MKASKILNYCSRSRTAAHQCNFSTGSVLPSTSKSRQGHIERIPLSYNEYDIQSSNNSPLSPVFMAHGLLGSKQNWNSIAKAVSKLTERKVVTFDNRNHGDSPHSNLMSYEAMVEDVLGLSDLLGIDKFIFLGHSMSGRIACALALEYPQRLSALVVVDISPLSLGGDFDQMRLYLEAMNSIFFDRSLTLSEARKIADLKLKPVVQDSEVRAFLLTNLSRGSDGVFWKPNLQVLLKNLAEIKTFPVHLLSSKFSAPAFFIRGQKSPYVADGDFENIRKLFPKAELATIRNAGHWPHAESPQEFIDTLVSFLKKLE